MKIIRTKTTYLQMRSAPQQSTGPPRSDVRVRLLDEPTVAEYRALYQGVGGHLHWFNRLLISESELVSILHHPANEVYVLEVANERQGFFELDLRDGQNIEVAYFGLFPAVIGQGLGKYLLGAALDVAWSKKPGRVWLHTCDLDHPAALPNYLRAGFQVYDERMVDQQVPT
ncbi:MAG: GNAT family N-acetyltransferase [Planctomycetales bacterium]|nr:GNAT family N-acetyltransferase [Planctomycetales bacterium]